MGQESFLKNSILSIINQEMKEAGNVTYQEFQFCQGWILRNVAANRGEGPTSHTGHQDARKGYGDLSEDVKSFINVLSVCQLVDIYLHREVDASDIITLHGMGMISDPGEMLDVYKREHHDLLKKVNRVHHAAWRKARRLFTSFGGTLKEHPCDVNWENLSNEQRAANDHQVVGYSALLNKLPQNVYFEIIRRK